jgi:polysaccharide biosynthesis transport protein
LALSHPTSPMQPVLDPSKALPAPALSAPGGMPPPAGASGSALSPLSFPQFLHILRARWTTVMLTLFTVVAVVVIVSLLLPKQYTGTASVVVDPKMPDHLAGVAMTNVNAQSYMATQIDVMRSERVARKALRSIGLHESPELKEQWLAATQGVGDFEAWISQSLHRKLEVTPSRESNAITLSFTAPTREMASTVANAFMRAYIDTALDLRVEPARQYNAFFDERARQMRAELEQAQRRLSDYQREKGLITTDERLDVEHVRLAELSSQLVALQAAEAESRGRQAQASSRGESMSEVLSSPVLPELVAELSRQEARLEQLRERLGAAHPELQAQVASVERVRQKIQAETRRAASSTAVTQNVNHARLTELRAALEEQRARVLRLRDERDEAAVLVRDVESAQRAYDAMLTRVSQTNLESQNTQANVSILKEATPPAAPSSPRVMLNLAAALVLGSMLAVAMALLRELLDWRMRSDEDVLVRLGVPVLVNLPATGVSGWRHRLQARRTKTRLVSGVARGAS